MHSLAVRAFSDLCGVASEGALGEHVRAWPVVLVGVAAAMLAGCSSAPASAPLTAISGTPSLTSSAASDAGASTAPDESESSQAAVPGFLIQTHSRDDLRNYSEFSYMTATTTGLSAEAAATADERIKGVVDATVSDAVAGDDDECMEGESKCGYFQQSLKPLACTDGYLCVQQNVNAAWVGMAISDVQVAVLVLDPQTGRAANLSDVVLAKSRDAFLSAVNKEVSEVQKSAGVYNADDAPNFTEADFAAWAPLPDGIHIWFPKYTAGGGFMGVVEVVVPYPTDVSSGSGTAGESSPASSSTANWTRLENVETDPVFVILKAYREMPDGSMLLTVDPLSPDMGSGVGDGCPIATFQKPDGAYCLTNTTVRDRRVTLKPNASVWVGDSGTTFKSMVDYISQGPTQVYVHLDKNGFADAIEAYEPWIPDSSTTGQTPAEQAPQEQQTSFVTVPNVIGLTVDSAANRLKQAGLAYSIQPAGGVSAAQQARGGCLVASQNPRWGQSVQPGSWVNASFNCPTIPQPALPQPYTGADSGQYNGPAPPPAWTGH